MVKIGDVWDSTTDVLAGRAGLLAPVAALAFALPSIVQSGVKIYGGASPGVAALAALIGLAGLVANLWGQMTIVAVASDPATTRAEAGAAAARRLPAALLVVLVLAAAAIALTLPIFGVLAATGYDFAAAAAYQGTGPITPMPGSAKPFLTLYGLAAFVVGLWLSARLFLTNAVIINERRAIGALGRSITLTRGLTLKLIAVALLLGVALLIAVLATQSIAGIVFRLLLGPDNPATVAWLAAIVVAALTAAFLVVVQVFAARLYAAILGGSARAPA